MVAFAVYSACVDPDRVLRALRPLAGRSALTATLVSRLVPVAAADAGRLRDAAPLRGPGAAPRSGAAPLARRLLAGSLDRAVDVAATLELRGYSLGGPRGRAATRAELATTRASTRSGAVVLAAAIVGKVARRRRLPRLPDDRDRRRARDAGGLRGGAGERLAPCERVAGCASRCDRRRWRARVGAGARAEARRV